MPSQNTQVQDPNMAQQSPQMEPQTDAAGNSPGGMSADDLAAALGYITTVSQHMFHGQTQDPNQDPNAQGDQKPQEDLASMKDEIMGEIDSLRQEIVGGGIKKEFEDIKNELAKLQEEENGQENKD